MSKKVTTPYFPQSLKYSTPLIFIAGLYLLWDHPVWGTLLLLLGVVILTTHYATAINLTTKTYTDYLFLLGMKLNAESGKFQRLNKIVITKGTFTQTANTIIRSRTFEYTDFTGTLIFWGDHKLELLTDIRKKTLIRRLKPFAKFLDVGIEDRTTPNPYWIDIDKY
ncbi:MAG TPA: hypothetical protein VD816_16145 [Ohtaekwangia sp.]|nr:hypothetical protein [Ohtaekwangia sp.]